MYVRLYIPPRRLAYRYARCRRRTVRRCRRRAEIAGRCNVNVIVAGNNYGDYGCRPHCRPRCHNHCYDHCIPYFW